MTTTAAVARVKGDTPDPETVARLSALPEPRILDYVWTMNQHPQIDRLSLLLTVGAVVVVRPPEWSCAAIRRAHERGADGATCTITRRRCFACEASQVRLYFHHIVEVHHGGSNAPRNQVPLCFPCHQYLHPWLTEEVPERSSGFEMLSQIAPRLVVALERALVQREK